MKPSIPQGNRDFGADKLRQRKYITNTIEAVFLLYGFEPLETPAMENLETLTGKYGAEGDKLIFKILNNGLNNPAKEQVTREGIENILKGKSDKNITERALRYDLTIPFARYVAMNYGQLTMPYKRYQIQPVWRADRPQRGRYREFYQCDADVAGTYSYFSDAEFACIYSEVFSRLKIPVAIKINNRKILYALAETCGLGEAMQSLVIIIDKLDKIGLKKVVEESAALGLSEKSIEILQQYLMISGSNAEKLAAVKKLLGNNASGMKGIEELNEILSLIEENFKESPVVVDFNLARGLNYYTGTIYEVQAKDVVMGSIGGGGRYDDLTGLFGIPGVPGVGISFGLDRIYDVMEELNLFPETLQQGTTILFLNMGEKESRYAFGIMQQCRQLGISCELYFEKAKLDKQIKYALKRKIHFGVIIGSEEMESKEAVLKDLNKNSQEKIAISRLYEILTNHKISREV
ncbi:MAG: histidine--tRNA ligase [Bacteroidetes bacterium]|nr:histidine--tRNA ligase [Bacteroidota bacterium]